MADDLKTPVPSSVSVFAQRSTVTLLVGTDEEPLVAHESYTKKNSEFFQAAVMKEWVEGQTRVIKLPEDDVETMTNYLTFTYSCELPTSKLVKGRPARMNVDWDSLAKLYVLGDRIRDKCVRNAITSEIARVSVLPDENGASGFMPAAASNILFDGTPEGSPIRQMIIDKHVSGGHKRWLDSGNDHPALVLEIARELLGKVAVHQPYGEFRKRQIKAEDYFV